MQKKDQTFTKFCEFKALVEKESDEKVKSLQSDNDGDMSQTSLRTSVQRKGLNGS